MKRSTKKTTRGKAGRKSRPASAEPIKLSPEHPAARDEGPRLIPLKFPEVGHPTLTHYVNLADTLLGTKKKKP